MSLTPAAIGIILDEKKTQVLLVKRKDVPVWVLPGGGIDKGELSEEAVVREVLEETGYHVRVERQSGEYYPINRLAALTFVYVCQIQSGQSGLSPETAAIDFFPLENLPPTFFSVHRDWLNDALHHRQLVKKQLIQVTYWAVIKHFFRHPILLFIYIWSRFFKKDSNEL